MLRTIANILTQTMATTATYSKLLPWGGGGSQSFGAAVGGRELVDVSGGVVSPVMGEEWGEGPGEMA